ncbi:tRNA pseudouridine(13) synthase TruD [Candidatus Woesearchaeota archaeon]|nr:tRNA pseudouridine(13) synthase TruD [Candidatus Woesearchaeota archaeon]
MRIKETCEDFLVEELIDTSLVSQDSTAYHLYKLKKTNYTTERAVQHIARALHLPRKFIGYAGAKDKRAVTTQYITTKGVKKDNVLSLELKDIALEFVGYATEQLTLGKLSGNTFTINVQEPDFIPAVIPETFVVPNYFDEQRFSSNNAAIGKAILKKEFKAAAELIIGSDTDYGSILVHYLQNHESDYVGAIHRLPKKILLFYVHAVQSLLFNELLAKEIKDGFNVPYSQGIFLFSKNLLEPTPQTLPLIGYDSELTTKQEELLTLHGLDRRNFIVKQFPELTLAGDSRATTIQVTYCKVLQQEKQHITIAFTLPKGAYATIVLKQLFASR